MAAIFAAVVLLPRPESVSPAGWRLLGLFLATIAGMILQPIPVGALVLIAVVLSSIIGGLTLGEALAGYGMTTVWLVVAAFMISRAIINSGLARRIALLFIRRFGGTSLGLCYALSFTDMTLATVIPSNAARSGGVVLPIALSIAELYGSRPGPTARRLGAYLMTGVYQGVCITAAMFYTGQASNPIVAEMAGQFGFEITWAGWALAGIVPGLCSLLFVPWLVMKINPPEILHTPEAREFAISELEAMGAMNRKEKIVAAIFAIVCGLWITSSFHGLPIAASALLGVCALLLTGALTWDDVLHEHAAWNIFVWYGGVLRLGLALNEAGITTAFAGGVGNALSGFGWLPLFAGALLIYFYIHYLFASITAHVLAMYAPFVALLLAQGAPLGLVVFAFGCFVNFAAGLTHYGTTPAPMYFGQEYTSLREWWTIGAAASIANVVIWATAGFAWWKLIGIW